MPRYCLQWLIRCLQTRNRSCPNSRCDSRGRDERRDKNPLRRNDRASNDKSVYRRRNGGKAKARLFIQDGDVLIGFTYLEISETTITGQSIAPDGSYKLYLSKEAGTSYFEHDDEVKSIASVTEAEIAGYNEMFGATYDPVSNKFAVQIGTVSTQLTPGQMMLTTEEYNKASNDADYTAMWAYAIAEYICCPPWFEGFAGFKLHSAFYKAEKQSLSTLIRLNCPLRRWQMPFTVVPGWSK